MSKGQHRRAIALIIPIWMISRPFETFTFLVGIMGVVPTFFRLDNSDHVYDRFPLWVPVTWMILMVLGSIRTIYGLKRDDRYGIAAGSSLTSWMIVTNGIVTLYHTNGRVGWFLAIIGGTMVLLSTARGFHLTALAQEMGKVHKDDLVK